jgi:NADH dehydrogenase
MTRIGVTGASGFLARHLIPVLLAEGHELRGMARSEPQPASGPTVTGFEFRRGDVRNETLLQWLFDGSSVAIHLAASFAPSPDAGDIITTGTEAVIGAAKAAGVERLIVLSCLGAQASARSPLYAAKWEADQLVRASGLPYTILRSSLILGNGDGITRPLACLMRSSPIVPVPGSGTARLQPVDVGDLSRCIAVIVSRGIAENEEVSVGGPMFLTYRQLVDLIAGELGLQRRKLLVPYRSVPAVSRLVPASARGIFYPARVEQLNTGIVASPGIVHRIFGFEPSNIVPGIPAYLA